MKNRILAASIVLMFSSASYAAADDALASAILGCASQSGDQAQLACYKAVAAQLKAAPANTAAVPPPSGSPAPSAPVTAAAAPPANVSGVASPSQENRAWYDVGSWFGGNSNVTASPPRTVVGTPEEFGKENLPPSDSDPVLLDHITAGVTNVSFNFFGHFTVTLDNGQVWRQETGDNTVNRFPKDQPFTVTIKRGFLGSFRLSIDGRSGSYQVKRIK